MKRDIKRSILFSILNDICVTFPELEPCRNDSNEDLFAKYFYWVDEYNDGCNYWNVPRPVED